MPGLHKPETLSEAFKLRAQEVIDIEVLEFLVGFLKVVWTMVSSQRKCLIECNRSIFVACCLGVELDGHIENKIN